MKTKLIIGIWCFLAIAFVRAQSTAFIPSISRNDEAFELGNKISVGMPGKITAIRHWKLLSDTGPHIGHIWDSTGRLIATVPFLNETSLGWQEQRLDSPIPFKPGPYLIVTVNSNNKAHFPIQTNGFANALITTVNGIDFGHPPSASLYGPIGVFPTSPSPHNYFREVVFALDSFDAQVSIALAEPIVGSAVSVTGHVSNLEVGSYTVDVAVTNSDGRTVKSSYSAIIPK